MDPVILKGRRVTREESPVAKRERAIAQGRQAEVKTLTQDGAIRVIEVRCACGDVVTIELDASGSPPAQPAN